MSRANSRTPLLRDHQGLPVPIGSSQVQDHPIFLRVCHSPWPNISQTALTYIRAFLVTYLTAVAGILIDYKLNKEDDHTNWRIIFQFSTVSFFLLWLYHLIAFAWTFTHLYYPDIEEDDRRWESVVLKFASPPVQTAYSRKRFYYSLFYTLVHVFVFMNAITYWTVLVPQGHGHFPAPDTPSDYPIDDFFSEGWFKPFSIFNLWVIPTLIAIFEVFVLNSIKRQVPVASHIFAMIFFASAYLGYAALGWVLTGHRAFFWLDPKVVGRREYVAGYCVGFVGLAPTVFSFLYGLIGMRENLAKKDSEGNNQFNPGEFIQNLAQNVQDEFQRHTQVHE